MVRNFAKMLEVCFPQDKSLIIDLLEAWDGAEYKSTKEAGKLVDSLIDLVLYVKKESFVCNFTYSPLEAQAGICAPSSSLIGE
ncbi:MAG: hypothetical protein ACREBS_08785 [Nitrososphaerales archaeon]